MNRSSLVLLTRAVAVWLGAAAVVTLAMRAQVEMAIIRGVVRFSTPRLLMTHVLFTLIFGGVSILGVVGAVALWRCRNAGRLACVVFGAALIIGWAPAAILRGQVLWSMLLGVTLAAVLWLCSRSVARLCAATR
jgi:hypothetical protein